VPVPILGESLNGRDLMPVGLHREHRARPDRFALHEHGARPAVGRFAPDHGPRQIHILTQEMHQQHPGLDLALVIVAVYLDPYFSQPALLSLTRSPTKYAFVQIALTSTCSRQTSGCRHSCQMDRLFPLSTA